MEFPGFVTVIYAVTGEDASDAVTTADNWLELM
jgi:hypothetical protein